MASDISSSSPLIGLLRKSFTSAIPEAVTYSVADLAKAQLYPSIRYTEPEKAEISQWLITSLHIASPDEDGAKAAERLSTLNTHLASRTTLLGAKPSVADVAMYTGLAPAVQKWDADERTGKQGYHHIVRYLDFVQNAEELFQLKLEPSEKVTIDPSDVRVPVAPIDPKVEKERRKKEKEAAVAAGATGGESTLPVGKGKESTAGGGRKAKKEAKAAAKAETSTTNTGDTIAAAVGSSTLGVSQSNEGVDNATKSGTGPTPVQPPKEKKEKQPKQPKPQKNAPAPDKPLSPALIDLRVGHILKAERHPNADSLYVSTIACGDSAGTDNTSEYEGQVVRTVCSGLNGLVPLEEMQRRKIVAVCNLKPVTMRGIKSAAMVLAASPRVPEGGDAHAGPVELVSLPDGAEAGDRVSFEGWEGEPEAVLNPKKKVWEMCQVGFTTTAGREVAFERGAVEQLKGGDGGGKEVALLMTKTGVCTVKTLTGATVR